MRGISDPEGHIGKLEESGASRRGREAAGGPGVEYSRVSGFPVEVCVADYFWEVLKSGVVA